MAQREEVAQVIADFLGVVRTNYASLSDSVKRRVGSFLSSVSGLLGGDEPQAPPDAPIPNTARLLWQLAGRSPSAFVKYVAQYPDAALRPYLQDRNRLVSLVEELEAEMPKEAPEQMGGIPKAWLESSNVYGYRYDPANQRLLVRFHPSKQGGSGPVYEYTGVPKEVYDIIRNGAIPAKTDGSNRHGTWWKGKNPSLGAAVNALLSQGPFPYRKLSG